MASGFFEFLDGSVRRSGQRSTERCFRQQRCAQPATTRRAECGKGNDTLDGGDGDDILQGGTGSDKLTGGAGNDTLVGSVGSDTLDGGVGDDFLLGETGSDILIGGSGNDTFTGTAGANTLDGGAGDDYLSGGAGNDVYVVDSAGDVVVEAVGGGIDKIILRNLTSYVLQDTVENLDVDNLSGVNVIGNSANNVLRGGEGSDVFYGQAGNDVLYGFGGDDVLDGGSGSDTLIGGTGNDTYYVDNAGDKVVEAFGEGMNDAVYIYNLTSYVLPNNVEDLYVAAATTAVSLKGNSLDNSIQGYSGNDVLYGFGGDDMLDGGTGNDTYYVDDIGDKVVEAAGEGTNDTVCIYNLTSYVLPNNVENLYVAAATTAVNLKGNSLDNSIQGYSGNDSLSGEAGNDYLYGRSGNDSLSGGAGDDYLYGGLGNDLYIFGQGQGNDKINNYISSGHGTDTLKFQNLSMSAVEFSTSTSGNLICTISATGETLTVYGWTGGSSYWIESFSFTDGSLSASQVNAKL